MKQSGYRRVVAGLDSTGRSAIVADDLVDGVALGSVTIAQMWIGALASGADEAVALAGSTVPFRFEQFAEPAYAFMVADYAPGLGRDDPGMHRTDTVDHFHVIAGEVVLVLETGGVTLRAGDSGICRGVIHGWRNDSDSPVRLVTFVLPAAGESGR